MKSDLGKLIMIVWLSVMAYFAYEIWVDVHYIADLIHAYVTMSMEHIRH